MSNEETVFTDREKILIDMLTIAVQTVKFVADFPDNENRQVICQEQLLFIRAKQAEFNCLFALSKQSSKSYGKGQCWAIKE